MKCRIFIFHVKLYLFCGWKEEEMLVKNPKVWFDEYLEFVISLLGGEWGVKNLKKLASEIKDKALKY